jgi:ribokinase
LSARGVDASGGPEVFAAGTVNADFVLAVDRRLERGASLVAHRFLRASGGRAGNVAVMVRRLATPARLYGCVGDDELSEQALAGPRKAGVELDAVRQVPGDTGVVMVVVGDGGAKTMVFAPGANASFSAADGSRLATDLRSAAAGSVLVVDTELEPASLEPALQTGRPSVLDPTRPERVTDRLLGLALHVTPNADEAAALTGIPVESPGDARRAARRLRERGARNVHVRLRRGGCFSLWPDGEALMEVPEPLDAVDTTGAGDAFAGTLATAIIARLPPINAARLAVAAAAWAVTGFGAQESYPDPPTLYEMAREIRVAIGAG